MKVSHRIRRYLILLLFTLHTAHSTLPQAFEFASCGTDKRLVCAVHATCIDENDSTEEYYKPRDNQLRLLMNKCTRYLAVRATSLDKMEIEFRDDTIVKSVGAEILSTENELTFKCVNNKAISNRPIGISDTNPASDKLYCKFDATAKNPEDKKILKVLSDASFGKIKSGSKTIKITGMQITRLDWPCEWMNTKLFSSNANAVILDDEESEKLKDDNFDKICPPKYFNWYSKEYPTDNKSWKRINEFTCSGSVISTTNLNGEKEPLHFTLGHTKCSRPKCAVCPKPEGSQGNYTGSDGTSCAKITCPKFMMVETQSGIIAHSNKTIQCATTSTGNEAKWEVYGEVKNVTCVADIRCVALHPIDTKCPEDPSQLPAGKNCTTANLDSQSTNVCSQDQEIWFAPKGGVARQVASFKCTGSGSWEATNAERVTIEHDSNVYCLMTIQKPAPKRAAPQPASAGKLIGIICAVAVVVIIIIIVVVFCARRQLKKKGNRHEMKSVSVTGRGEKKKKNSKKDKKSSSKTSEISAPPPPPCPDSLPGLRVEQDPPNLAPPSSGGAAGAPPSSEGGAKPAAPAAPAAAVPVVGPDTGKPDKPAELIDIKPDSDKKDKETEKESKKSSKDQEGTIVNTVTGTQSGAEPVKPTDPTADTTKKTGKNGDSARSNTGKKTKTSKKDIKMQVDKHGRGLTDDDDYNIDEGAKPVNNVDKNKKPYAPAVDPRKKMINVTMTEDEDGHLKPRGAKDSLF